mmetsp:Transcript_24368/g.84689  ORF Transcript_24368/g.84689 Transcript_24368/m.84689 type:complete len:286 (-) Transcript_24368:136-993(-)
MEMRSIQLSTPRAKAMRSGVASKRTRNSIVNTTMQNVSMSSRVPAALRSSGMLSKMYATIDTKMRNMMKSEMTRARGEKDGSSIVVHTSSRLLVPGLRPCTPKKNDDSGRMRCSSPFKRCTICANCSNVIGAPESRSISAATASSSSRVEKSPRLLNTLSSSSTLIAPRLSLSLRNRARYCSSSSRVGGSLGAALSEPNVSGVGVVDMAAGRYRRRRRRLGETGQSAPNYPGAILRIVVRAAAEPMRARPSPPAASRKPPPLGPHGGDFRKRRRVGVGRLTSARC